ncbi:MAG: GC-type dockerin domain-anchored protein [Planctomycetota bacterium]
MSKAMYAVALLAISASTALAQMGLFDSRNAFLGPSTAATIWPTASATGATSIAFERFTVTGLAGTNGLVFDEWTPRLTGLELAVSGPENLRFDFAEPLTGFGIEFVEPELDDNVNAPFVDSTFRVDLYDGETLLDSAEITRPNDEAAFIGVTCPAPFDRVEIIETVGGTENEFFGRVYLIPVEFCAADLTAPFGVLDLDDVDAFIAAFLSGDLAADLAPPFGVIDLSCVNRFITTYLSGCP